MLRGDAVLWLRLHEPSSHSAPVQVQRLRKSSEASGYPPFLELLFLAKNLLPVTTLCLSREDNIRGILGPCAERRQPRRLLRSKHGVATP